jgi:hypothetical protein
VAGLVPSDGELVRHARAELWYMGAYLPLETATGRQQPPPHFLYYLAHAHPEHKRLYWFNDVSY